MDSENCGCRFQDCVRPRLYCGKSTDGTIVTWKPDSPEADVEKVRDEIDLELWYIKRTGEWPDWIIEWERTCIACSKRIDGLSFFEAHLIGERERLDQDLMVLLDAQVEDPGK